LTLFKEENFEISAR